MQVEFIGIETAIRKSAQACREEQWRKEQKFFIGLQNAVRAMSSNSDKPKIVSE